MKKRSFFASLAAIALFTAACSSSVSTGATTSTGGGQGGSGGAGGAGGGAACFVPTQRLSLSLLAGTECNSSYPNNGGQTVLEGTFEPIAGGFRVSKGGEQVEITEAEPAIPQGTFVRLSYGCQPGFYGDAGAHVILENLDELDGVKNPTEAGTRLWFTSTAGGEAGIPKGTPFKLGFLEHCTVGDFEQGTKSPEELEIKGQGVTVTVEPGQQADFTETTGPQAGKYRAENVNITFVGFPGGDATTNVNYRITRAD